MLSSPYPSGDAPIISRLNYDQLSSVLERVKWYTSFVNCAVIDDYADCLTILNNAVLQSTSVKHCPRRQRPPKHMVRLLYTKRKAWKNGLLSRNFDTNSDLKKLHVQQTTSIDETWKTA